MSNTIHDMSFEEAYDALQTVITKLESGDLPLDESVTLYERGQKLSARCQHLLDNAESRIQQLNNNGSLTDVG
jgi:exodeoxyribonuclease VII small subunit